MIKRLMTHLLRNVNIVEVRPLALNFELIFAKFIALFTLIRHKAGMKKKFYEILVLFLKNIFSVGIF